MQTFDFDALAGLIAGAVLLFVLATAWAYRARRMARAAEAEAGAAEGAAGAVYDPVHDPAYDPAYDPAAAAPDAEPAAVPMAAPAAETPAPRKETPRKETPRKEATGRRGRAEARLEEIEILQADLAARLDALATAQNEPREQMQAFASQLLTLIRDKNATFEAELAGLNQLRARMRALEQVGDLGETRQIIDGLRNRLDEMQASRAADMAGIERRLEMLGAPEGNAIAEISGVLTRLHSQKDEAIEAMLRRLGEIEGRLGGIEGGGPDRVAARLEAQVAALETAQGDVRGEISALRSGLAGAGALARQVEDMQAQGAEADQFLAARLEALEEALARQNPEEMLDRFADRLEALRAAHAAGEGALKDRIAALEAPGENPFAEISEQLTRLYAQKDATVETVFARLAPLEEKLAGIETRLAARPDPGALPGDAARRLEALGERVAALEGREGAPFAEISEQLARLHDRKDAAAETVLSRLGPLEEKIAAVERGLAGRLDAVDWAQEEIVERLGGIGAAARIAAREAVSDRMEPLERKLAGIREALAAQDPGPMLDRFADRLDALRAAHAAAEGALKDRITALEHPAGNPFAEISEQLTRLYAQKDATVETVFARLAPLEEKLAGIETRLAARPDPEALLDGVAGRLDALRDRVAALETPGENPFAEISEQLTRLYAQKDATVETVFARLAPLEDALAALERDADPEEIRRRLDALDQRQASGETELRRQIEALAEAQGAARSDVAALRAETVSADLIAQRLEGLHAQKDALSRTLMERMGALEADMDARDPARTIAAFEERIEAMRERLAALETPGESPFAEISGQLTRLYAQKDAAVEMVLERLAPLERKLVEAETGLAGRLDALDWAQSEMGERLAGLGGTIESAAAREAAARIAPLEAKLADMAGTLAERDPQAVLDAFADRLASLRERVSALETPGESPFAEISEQLTRLYAQKDATVETVFGRLAPLEEKLSAVEAGLSARLDALDWVQDEVAERLAGIRAASEQSASDRISDTIAARIAPLEARFTALEGTLAGQDPQAALDRFAERLEALRAAHAASERALKHRLTALENPGENPFTEISEQLTRLYAQKDATVETVFARLAPLEEKLADLEDGLAAAADPARLEALAARLDAMARTQDETAGRLADTAAKAEAAAPVLEIRKELAQAFARRDADMDGLLERLAPLEARLAELEARPWDPEADEARAEAQEVAIQMIAARAAVEHTELFADRLALLEATLPRLSVTQTVLMKTLERKKGDGGLSARVASSMMSGAAPGRSRRPRQAPAESAAEDMEDVWSLPQLVSLHRK